MGLPEAWGVSQVMGLHSTPMKGVGNDGGLERLSTWAKKACPL